MFKYIFVLATFIFAAQANAQKASCRENIALSCTTTYSIADGTTNPGQTLTSQVKDLNPEPFDPPECVASNVFMTNEGKVIATYDDGQKELTILVDDTGQAEKNLVDHMAFTSSESISVKLKAHPDSKYQMVNFSCSLLTSK